jgi:hypothetical protein
MQPTNSSPARDRASFPFTWYASCGMTTYAALAGVRLDRLFLDADAIVQAYTIGEPLARALFGAEVQYGDPAWAGISYGHVNCLGSPLRFPYDSEVAHAPIYDSLAEGIRALQRPVDWANAGMMPFYLDLWEKLKRAFPERGIPFGGFGLEGPITTAWELRGHGFFMDLYDDPQRYLDFLHLVTESIVQYHDFICQVNDLPTFSEAGGSLYDDISSLLGPGLWPRFVLPFHEHFFVAQTSGRRHAHIENLTPNHLRYLDDLGLDSFDPSVSPRLRPVDLRDRCQVPFLWRINAMQIRDFSRDQVRRFVFESVGQGASGVFLVISSTMLQPAEVEKVKVFIDAAKQVEALLAEGRPRDRLPEAI